MGSENLCPRYLAPLSEDKDEYWAVIKVENRRIPNALDLDEAQRTLDEFILG